MQVECSKCCSQSLGLGVLSLSASRPSSHLLSTAGPWPTHSDKTRQPKQRPAGVQMHHAVLLTDLQREFHEHDKRDLKRLQADRHV